MYYAFASTAAIVGPTLAGVFMDINVHYLFPFSISFLVLALIFLFMVKTGEVGDVTGDVMAEMID